MSESKTRSEQLEVQYLDLVECYEEAKINDDRAAMERFSKTLLGMQKEMRAQEEHEKATVPRATVISLVRDLGREFCGAARALITDVDEQEALWLQVQKSIETNLSEYLE